MAAFQQALETVIGWEQPNFENAGTWCQRAAEWDHEPAKRLFALMHERGWGGPVDMQEAAKWNAAVQEQRLRAQKKQQAQEEAESPGGLSLAPMASASHGSAAAAPVVWTGNPLRDLPGWYAREGDPHAAFHLGTSDEHGRYGGPVNLAQARAWYAQAAEAGHADATYNLGTFIESGKGGPKDVQVAKALFMLANTRGTTMQVADLGIKPQEQGAVRALVVALREPGRRGGARGAAPVAAVVTRGSGFGARSGFSLHLGHVALGLVAAFGAWRTARDFDWSPLARAVVALLAAIPLLGMAVCLGLLFKAFRAR